MIISAEKLWTLDACELRAFYEQRYEPKSITPLRMLYQAVEAGISDSDPEQAAKDECMRIASSKDLQVEHLNRFMTIRHIGYLGGIISLALQSRLGILRKVSSVELDGFTWESGLFETREGVRHRIELVSHLDDDRLRASAHSWRVVGELAALETPLTLTCVVIGAQRGGRRHSEWSKGLLHPHHHGLRFSRRNKKTAGFSDNWEKVWREHRSEISTEKWLESMSADGVLDDLIISREIPYKEDSRIEKAKRDMLIATRAKVSENSPMRRSSCDDFGGCPYGFSCWSATPKTPGGLPHLYSIRDMPDAKPTKGKSPQDTAVSPHPVPAAPVEQGHLRA